MFSADEVQTNVFQLSCHQDLEKRGALKLCFNNSIIEKYWYCDMLSIKYLARYCRLHALSISRRHTQICRPKLHYWWLPALDTEMYLGLPALGTKINLGLTALGTKMYLGLPALGTGYRADSPWYKSLSRAGCLLGPSCTQGCQPWVQKCT